MPNGYYTQYNPRKYRGARLDEFDVPFDTLAYRTPLAEQVPGVIQAAGARQTGVLPPEFGREETPGIVPLAGPGVNPLMLQQMYGTGVGNRVTGIDQMVRQALSEVMNPNSPVNTFTTTTGAGDTFTVKGTTPLDRLKIERAGGAPALQQARPQEQPRPVPEVAGPAPQQPGGLLQRFGGALAAPFQGESALNTAAILGQIGQAIMGPYQESWQARLGGTAYQTAQAGLYQRYLDQVLAGVKEPTGVSALSPELRTQALQQATAQMNAATYQQMVEQQAKAIAPWETEHALKRELAMINAGEASWQGAGYGKMMLTDRKGNVIREMNVPVAPRGADERSVMLAQRRFARQMAADRLRLSGFGELIVSPGGDLAYAFNFKNPALEQGLGTYFDKYAMAQMQREGIAEEGFGRTPSDFGYGRAELVATLPRGQIFMSPELQLMILPKGKALSRENLEPFDPMKEYGVK